MPLFNLLKRKNSSEKKVMFASIKLKWWWWLKNGNKANRTHTERGKRKELHDHFHLWRIYWNGMESAEHQEFQTWTYWFWCDFFFLYIYILTLRLPTKQIIKVGMLCSFDRIAFHRLIYVWWSVFFSHIRYGSFNKTKQCFIIILFAYYFVCSSWIYLSLFIF